MGIAPKPRAPQQDVTSLYSNDMSALPLMKGPEDMPQPEWGDTFKAGFRTARDDWIGQGEQNVVGAYGPVIEALSARNGKSVNRYILLGGGNNPIVLEDGIFRDLAEIRKTDPTFLPDVPHDAQSFRQHVAEQQAARRKADQLTIGRDKGWGSTLGGFAGAAADPVNLATLPLGGGGATIARRVLTEALVNAAVEGVEQPIIAGERAQRGESLSLGEAGMNIGSAFLLGGAMQGAIVEPLHALAKRMLPADRMTDAERGAANLLERDSEIAAASPFKGGAGTEAHMERLDTAMRALDEAMAKGEPLKMGGADAAAAPIPEARSMGGADAAPARDMVKANIRHAESGGNDLAANSRSSAFGRYQFTAPTWLRYYRRRFGDQGLSEEAILAKRRDPDLQEQLMDDMTADHARTLAKLGERETAGNLYLMHFLGEGGGSAVLRADRGTPIERIVGEGVVQANPFLRGKTAGDVIEWAHAKMGSKLPEGPAVRRDLFPDDAEGDALWRDAQRAADDAEAQAAAARTEVADTLGNDPVPEVAPAIDPAAPARAVHAPPLVPIGERAWSMPQVLPSRSRPSDVIEFLADRGGIRDDEGHALAGRSGVSRDMGKVFVPRAGPLLRKAGMTIDQAGELLHEGGFFLERPTTAEVLDMIERAVNGNEKIYALRDQAPMQERARTEQQDVQLAQARDQLEEALGGALTRDADPEMFDDILLAQAHGEDPWDAFGRLVNERLQNAIDRAAEEAKDERYGWANNLDRDAGPEGAAGADGGGRQAEPGAAGGGEAASGLDRPSGPPEAFHDPDAPTDATLATFDDPRGIGAQRQTESLEHDLRMQLQATIPPIDETDPVSIRALLDWEPRTGPPGVSVRNMDGVLAVATFRDESGAPRGIAQIPLTDEAKQMFDAASVYVEPAFRRQGIATQMYDALRREGYPIATQSGAGEMTPSGAAFANAWRDRPAPKVTPEEQARAVMLFLDRQRGEIQLRSDRLDLTLHDGEQVRPVAGGLEVHDGNEWVRLSQAELDGAAAQAPLRPASFDELDYELARMEVSDRVAPADQAFPGEDLKARAQQDEYRRGVQAALANEPRRMGVPDTAAAAEGYAAAIAAIREYEAQIAATGELPSLYRLDENGVPTSLQALFDDIDAEAAELQAARNCMAPPKGGQ